MIRDHITSRAAGSAWLSSANGLSRRGLLQAGAAVGGGLMLSLSLPFANSEAEAAGADGFAPNAFIRIGGDGQIVKALWKSLAGRHPGNRQLERDSRRVAAPAPSRCRCQNHVGSSCGKNLECRLRVLSCAKR